MIVGSMKQYYAYGLTIGSEFSLPELQPADPVQESADVSIQRDELEPVPSPGADVQPRRFEATPGVCRLTYEGLGTFRIEDGRQISVDINPELETKKVFRRMLEGQVFGILLHQRGLLVLHASAVAVDGRVTVFLGPVGAGKSTTAAACHAAGYWLLDDDLVVIETGGKTPVVYPGVPELKLYPEVADTLHIDSPVTGRDDDTGKQYHTTAAQWQRDPLPLERCYRLAEHETFELNSLPAHDWLLTLISDTYNAGLLEDTDTMSLHFEQCAHVIEAADVAELRRPDNLSALPGFVEEIVTPMQL